MDSEESWADRWVMFLLCISYLAISVVAIPFAFAASRNEGTMGTFTAVERYCDRNTGCDWTGTFKSDDGRINDAHAYFDSEDIRRPGDQARAQKGVPGDESLYKPNDKTWIAFSAAAVGCFAYVVYWIRRRRGGRRTVNLKRQGASPAPSGPTHN